MGVLNCERTRAYAPVARVHILPAAIESDGSEIDRPAARHSTSIRQPLPTIASPPMSHDNGTNTSLPELGPFWKALDSGMWRRPMFTPLCDVGISASLMASRALSAGTWDPNPIFVGGFPLRANCTWTLTSPASTN